MPRISGPLLSLPLGLGIGVDLLKTNKQTNNNTHTQQKKKHKQDLNIFFTLMAIVSFEPQRSSERCVEKVLPTTISMKQICLREVSDLPKVTQLVSERVLARVLAFELSVTLL